MDKWEKVVLLHRAFSSAKYCLSIEAILQKLECSAATFHRIRRYMVDALGAPIVFDAIYKGYCYAPADDGPFELPGIWFTQEEIESLLCIDHAINSLQQGLFGDIFLPAHKRLGRLLRAQQSSPAAFRERIKILSIGSRRCNQEIFNILVSSVLHHTRVSIDHHGLPDDAGMVRSISPQCIVRYRDNWYVDAFCHVRNELRTFAINRIRTASVVPGKFRIVSKRDLDLFYGDSYGIFTGKANKRAMLHFCGSAALDVAEQVWHPKQAGSWINATTYALEIPYGHSCELVMDILRWGDKVEVITPVELRMEVKGVIGAMMKKYKK